jgi:hypothetical protein
MTEIIINLENSNKNLHLASERNKMKNSIKILFALLSGLAFPVSLSAQESVNAGGGDISNNGYQIAYSIGEVFYTTESNASYIITQGVQQPYSNDLASNFDVTATNTTICAGQTTTLKVNFGPTYPPGTVNCNGTSTEVVDVTNPVTGKTWMDRNLGASRAATSSTDDQAYGDLYQWGRGADGHQCRNSATTSTLSSTDQPDNSLFINGGILNGELINNDWRSPLNNNLWQGVNGINNPCPIGYRLPTRTEFESELASWSSGNALGAFTSPLKLPLSGSRESVGGVLGGVGEYGDYWSSTVNISDGTSSVLLEFSNSYALTIATVRVWGHSTRCIKD